MADKNRDRLGAPRIDREEIEAMRQRYEELLGFVPPRIEARIALGSRLDPELLELQEQVRARTMYPKCFDVKTSQLIIFAVLLGLMTDAARLHALAARRAGATWEELYAVVGLTYLFRGMSAANLGAEILRKIAEEEGQKV